MKKKQLMTRDEMKHFVSTMFVLDEEITQWHRAYIRERVRQAGYGDNTDGYFYDCIDRLK